MVASAGLFYSPDGSQLCPACALDSKVAFPQVEDGLPVEEDHSSECEQCKCILSSIGADSHQCSNCDLNDQIFAACNDGTPVIEYSQSGFGSGFSDSITLRVFTTISEGPVHRIVLADGSTIVCDSQHVKLLPTLSSPDRTTQANVRRNHDSLQASPTGHTPAAKKIRQQRSVVSDPS